MSDFYPHGQVAQLYGVLRPEGYSERAIFVIDRQGIIRYVDVHDIDEQPDNEELFRVLAELAPTSGGVRRVEVPAPAPQPAAIPEAQVVLYCTPWCPECRRARAFLKQHHISYVEMDVSRDRAAAERLRGWTGGFETTPTFDIQGRILVEFREAALAEALGIGKEKSR